MAKHSELSEQIEQVVREYVTGALREAQDAIGRGFGGPQAVVRSSGGGTRRSVAGGARRSEAEMAAVVEALYAAVCAQPGETMAVLAPQLGESPKQLHRPMSRLRRDGRVRSVGARSWTRYFPLTKQG